MTQQQPAQLLAGQVVEAGGGAVRAIVMYGSRLLRTRPDAHSAYDFVVIVDEYRPFYAALRAAGELPRPIWLMTAMARILAPNVIAFAPGEGRSGIAKCQIVSLKDFERALGPKPPDHFLLGRMLQRVETVWAAGPDCEEWVEEQLAGARGRVLTWMSPYLEGRFDAEDLGRRILEVCYRGELRPEARNRSDKIFEAQREHFRVRFHEVLERGAEEGALERIDSGYRLVRAASSSERRRWRRHFARSKARATARWFKHMITFANWLPYIERKVERHTGQQIELTALERKLPIIFLWPRAVRVLLSRPHREIEP